MAKKKSIFCFTHHDLDGVVTYLVTKWAHPGYKIDVKPLSSFNTQDLRQEIAQWMLKNNFSDFEKVFFLDLDVSGICDMIDHENVIIIDHHKSHEDNKKYTKAVAIVKVYPSAAMLAYRVFRKLYDSQFTTAQKTLVIYANDYDSYTLDFKEALMLNVIFWNTQKAFETFIENYSNGFRPFTKEQLAIFRIYENELKNALSALEIYQGVHADTDGEYRVVVATFASKFINEIATHILSEYEADVAIVVNKLTNHVSFRRPKDGTMKLDVFAKDIADGGGHENSAGGTITHNFMEFTKTLKLL